VEKVGACAALSCLHITTATNNTGTHTLEKTRFSMLTPEVEALLQTMPERKTVGFRYLALRAQ
jgi:hypothetical protein